MVLNFQFDFQRDPLSNFQDLFAEIESKVSKDPNAMSLATVDALGKPSLRTVLFKGLHQGAFSFYTNYDSEKSKALVAHPHASSLFFWSAFDLQVRVEGICEKMSRSDSEAYFKTRPRLSQIGAWASRQSQKISGPEELAAWVKEAEHQFSGKDVPCPPHWGGWLLRPRLIEFWFGQQGRLHDRYVYESQGADWIRYMKSP